MISGAQAMVKALEAEGVTTVFGYPGAAICPFYDALSRSSIRHILARGEQSAGHEASGYARISGRPSVCVATSGPGATNLFTAIATAYMDSIPVIFITGQVDSSLLGRDVFQEVDTTGAVQPFTKYSFLVREAAEIPCVFKEAFYLASTGRKGPVLIDMPIDVQRAALDFSYPETISVRGYLPEPPDETAATYKKVAAAIRAAKRPLVCAGGGVVAAGARAELLRFCEAGELPVVATLMGLDSVQSGHPLYFGMLGQSGTDTANVAVHESDLLIIVGARADNRAMARPAQLEKHASIVHIDIDAAEIGKNLGTTLPVVGDAKRSLAVLARQQLSGGHRDWLEHLTVLRREEALQSSLADKGDGFPTAWQGEAAAAGVCGSGAVDPRKLLHTLSSAIDADGIYVSDVGQNQVWSARGYLSRTGRFLTSGGMGTMGYALPAAIGAKLAAPERQVVAVCGDGAFQMSMAELGTAAQHNIPVKLVVINNGCLGLVREIQQNEYNGRETAVELSGSPQLELIAAAYGIPFLRLERQSDAENAIAALIENPDGSFLLECAVDAHEAATKFGGDRFETDIIGAGGK